ncbi:MAG: nucleotidyltransferase family protein [Deltaproteobacteria bacterium]|nr:nucleotidyltransferase family protein [Deltaproteobacteria bacterium]MBW2121172.1 nucleotidyltransferase family protein [Deltaproteobacteria bacterium]
MRISAIVLAAGRSTRMGTNKLLLELEGETLVERIVDVLLRCRLDRITVVTGFESERIRERLKRREVDLAHNPRFHEGMATSIRVGLRQIGPDTGAVLIALADHPLLTPELVDRLIEAYRRSDKGIVCPRFRGKRGHPVIFDLARYREALVRLEGDIGGREVVEAHRDDLLEFDVDSPAVIRDIDSLEDYEECRRLLGRQAEREGREKDKG